MTEFLATRAADLLPAAQASSVSARGAGPGALGPRIAAPAVRARIEQEAERVVEALAGRAGFDAVTQLSRRLPMAVVADLVDTLAEQPAGAPVKASGSLGASSKSTK